MAINTIPEITLENTALPFIEQPIFDAAQQNVIDHEQGFCLVTGPAGTGKTTVLAEAVVNKIKTGIIIIEVAPIVLRINSTKLGKTRVAVSRSASMPAVVWAAKVPITITNTVMASEIRSVTKSLGLRAARREALLVEIVITSIVPLPHIFYLTRHLS